MAKAVSAGPEIVRQSYSGTASQSTFGNSIKPGKKALLMLLSICIPTHHGRKDCLQELLESLLAEISINALEDDVEICVSDNASGDGTEVMLESYAAAYPHLIRRQRMAVNTGIRNFFSSVQMAHGEYAWLIGSDDVIIPNGVKRILESLRAMPDVPGITVNKLNFNGDLTALIGPDHDLVLPEMAANSRRFFDKRSVLGNLFFSFQFISAHVFRKQYWDEVVDQLGVDHILGFEHFPHAYVYSEIALRHSGWYWLSEYCVIQRLENFSFWSEVSNKKLRYAELHTADLNAIATVLFQDEPDQYWGVLRKLVVLYWNPWLVLQYASDPDISRAEIGQARQKCVRWFRLSLMFWILTYPFLIAPIWLNRFVYRHAFATYRWVIGVPALYPVRKVVRYVFHVLMRLLGVEEKKGQTSSEENAVALRFLRSRMATKRELPD
jgi:abequosyltransferase